MENYVIDVEHWNFLGTKIYLINLKACVFAHFYIFYGLVYDYESTSLRIPENFSNSVFIGLLTTN